MIRLFDILISLSGLLLVGPIFVLIALVGLFDTGSPIFLQLRVGRNRKPFTLVKFRTMRKDTISVASHLVNGDMITPFGRFLRSTKLDELPQLWNVLKGEMSLVGPRPCLYNQNELIAARTALNVYSARPGITGLAQIHQIDMSTPDLLAKVDREMLDNLSLRTYFKYVFLTLIGRGAGDKVRR